jgi:penicillin amidase
MNILKKTLLYFVLILVLLVATTGAWLYSQVDGSLAILDGDRTVWGLSQKTTIARDKQGIVTINAQNRLDAAVALGFVHAQERFFQMDLLRRNAAGELSSLFGEKALNYDKKMRLHRFRDRARKIFQQLPADQIDLLKAYTKGVNQGLAYLGAYPFEYILLRQDPVEWQEEDSILTIFSMYLDLQGSNIEREQTLGALKAILPSDAFKFINPQGSQWDAPIDNSDKQASPYPANFWRSINSTENISRLNIKNTIEQGDQASVGSNSWAVSGALTATGAAILENDMHLGIRVPNTWFRAMLNYPENNRNISVSGVTLPGTPNIVVGSNGHIAWGFTNSYGDYSDIIKLTTNKDHSEYLTPDGWKKFSYKKQIIAIKDKKAYEFKVKETIWGPVISPENNTQLLALKWLAHDDHAVNFTLIELEQATTLEQAFSIASRAAIPEQNMLVADSDGNIGWTVIGRLIQRSTQFGEVPQDWSTGEYQWLGELKSNNRPKVINPEQNRLWTANARVVGGSMLDKIGNGGYALGARAKQIKADLFAKQTFTEQDLLAIALDDRALFLTPWRDFILTNVLTNAEHAQYVDFNQVKEILTKQSPLKATADSVAYRLVRNFRIAVRNKVFSTLEKRLQQQNSNAHLITIRHQLEIPLWQLINQQPDNFLPQEQGTWQQLFVQALQETLAQMTQNQHLAKATWGQQNTSAIKHPMSSALPFLSKWLDMPAIEMAGDSYMPRVQGPAFGASERMVVSPGHESDGYLHMPTGQSGHPWSPYFGLGHNDWVNGTKSPFLPGKPEHTLTLLSY